VKLNDNPQHCGACGTVCRLDNNCTSSRCEICIPEVITATSTPANIPAGMRVQCTAGPDSFTAIPCPVVRCGRLTTWALSYNDNRNSFGIVTYDPQGNIVRQFERGGARYLWQITLNPTPQTVTFWGQSSATVNASWAEMRLP
jgi:hypothetical protein